MSQQKSIADYQQYQASEIMPSVAGVDEAGRGPLAGNVVAAAVILDPNNPIAGLDDSKKLTDKKRELLYQLIVDNSLAYSIACSNVSEIEQMNILQASLLAMKRAVANLKLKPKYVWVDGIHVPKLDVICYPLVKGDSKMQAIAAASILAKVTRDKEMISADVDFPQYGFAKHKGYPTAAHLEALRQHGPCALHRRTYAPVKKIILENNIKQRD